MDNILRQLVGGDDQSYMFVCFFLGGRVRAHGLRAEDPARGGGADAARRGHCVAVRSRRPEELLATSDSA